MIFSPLIILPTVALVAALFYAVYLYNKLVRARQLTREAWSGIDVQLKRRHELIPRLVEVVKGYSGFEKGTLMAVTQLRTGCQSAPNFKDRMAGEARLGGMLKAIVVSAENYPELKAKRQFLELHKALTETENQIQFARRYYNGTVRDYNTALETFPGLLIARPFGFACAEFFEMETPDEKCVPRVAVC